MGKLNITIIVLDTLRLDTFNKLQTGGRRLSELGNFIVLQNCIAPSSWTLPSHASLFTGMYPSEHGAHETRTIKALNIEKISLKCRTFVSDLKEMGYKTYAISANPYVHPVYGFNEFDSFKEESYFTDLWGHAIEVPKRLKPLLAKYREKYGGSFFRVGFSMLRDDPALIAETVWLPMTGFLTLRNLLKKLNAKVIGGWPIEKGGSNIVRKVKTMKLNRRFFMFINLMEAHDPYTDSKKTAMSWVTPFLKKPVSGKVVDLWKRLYWKAAQKGYSYAYDIIEGLISRFGENQIILLTSDHGQEFGEHGFIGHGTVLDDEVIKVPMAVMLPKNFRLREGEGYASLVNVRRFLEAALKGDDSAINQLFSREVVAESFGVPANISIVKGIDMKKLRAKEKITKRRFWG